MNPKITPEHLSRIAVVYVRQSTPGQVAENKESQQRQYALVESARAMGFASVVVIDDDLGRSGSGLVERPGFQKLVAMVCGGTIGAVFCIEASRLARNGRDWHHLIDLCALVGTLVIDPDGVYDPRLVNDRLLLGLKGSMSEYELSLLRQRGLAARDSKAQRGELQVAVPPGYCWDELGRIVMDPDERVIEAIRLVFRKFRELGSARQVLLWAKQADVKMPVLQQRAGTDHVKWQAPAYHLVLAVLKHPIYAGAYVFGRRGNRTQIVEGRARKTSGHHKPMKSWNVLLRDHHPAYISWDEFEEHQKMIAENAHMQKRTSRKSGRGGRALLTALVRCGRCGRMMRVVCAPATPIDTSVVVTTSMSALGFASALVAFAWIERSPSYCSKLSPAMRWRPRSERSNLPRKRTRASSWRCSVNSNMRDTRPRSRLVATRQSTRPSVSWRANWRRVGTMHSSTSIASRNVWPRWRWPKQADHASIETH